MLGYIVFGGFIVVALAVLAFIPDLETEAYDRFKSQFYQYL